MKVTNFGQCLHIIMVTGKCTAFSGDFFGGFGSGVEGRELCRRIFPWRNMSWGNRKFSEKGAGFSKITIKKTMKK